MGTVEVLAKEVERRLSETRPGLRKTVSRKLSLAVAAMLEAQTANTAVIANLLPLKTDSAHHRQQWLRRLLKNELLVSEEVMEPNAREILNELNRKEGLIVLSLDQTDLGNRFAILTLSLKVGNRALPLAWKVESGEANIGFDGQKILLERACAWLPEGAKVLFVADRFYPSQELMHGLKAHEWSYRLRLKGNLRVEIETGVTTTGQLAQGVKGDSHSDVRLFGSRVPTNIGILHEAGHKEPWIVAMDCLPTRETVLEYRNRWCIEPMFSDFKSRGFGLEGTHLEAPARVERLMLIMALAMYWCVCAGHEEAVYHPTLDEKKPSHNTMLTTGVLNSSIEAHSPGLLADFV
jgi:hypothetical protein